MSGTEEKRLKEAEAQFSREELSVKKTSTSSRKKESKDKLEFYPFPSDLMKHVAKFVNDGDHKNLAKLLQLSSSQYQLDMTAWKAKPTELGTIFCFLETAKEKASHTSDYESLKKQIEIFKSHTEKLSAGHRIYDIEKEKYPKDFRIFHNAVERTKKALLEKDLPAIKEGIRGLYINHKASEKKENPEIMASETQNIALHKPFTNG